MCSALRFRIQKHAPFSHQVLRIGEAVLNVVAGHILHLLYIRLMHTLQSICVSFVYYKTRKHSNIFQAEGEYLSCQLQVPSVKGSGIVLLASNIHAHPLTDCYYR